MLPMKKNVLFLCTGNSCRSQMAEGWAKKFWNQDFNLYSAGTSKHGMNKRAMQVMMEVGVDLSTHFSKNTDELPSITFDFIVTVCDHAHENCPFFPGGKIIHCGFQDPPFLTKNMVNEEEILSVYRRLRDEIKDAMKDLPRLLGVIEC
jgi:arsenate reductase